MAFNLKSSYSSLMSITQYKRKSHEFLGNPEASEKEITRKLRYPKHAEKAPFELIYFLSLCLPQSFSSFPANFQPSLRSKCKFSKFVIYLKNMEKHMESRRSMKHTLKNTEQIFWSYKRGNSTKNTKLIETSEHIRKFLKKSSKSEPNLSYLKNSQSKSLWAMRNTFLGKI